MPQKPPAFIKLGPNPWLFWSMAAWVSFVFILFFSKLYAGWKALIPVFSSAGYSPEFTSLSQRFSVWKDSFLVLATGFLVTGIIWSCGKRLFKWLSLQTPQPMRFCLEIGLGVFLLNNLWMGLGLVRLWMEPLWLTGFVFLTALFLRDLLKLYHQGITLCRPKGIHFWLAALCAFYMFFLLFHSLLPETFYDSLNYFLGMPAFWLWHHGICDYPTHLLSGYFHGGSLFFMNGFVLAGTEGAKVLASVVLFCAALVCYGWAGELAGPSAKAVAATAVLTFPLLYLNSWAIRVDGLLTFVLLLFFYALEKGVSAKKGVGCWIAVAGIFAGLALSIKPTAVVALVAALLVLLWRDGFAILKKKGWLVFGGSLVLGTGPWLLKNACFDGNPFFPYAISWMGGRQFPVWSYERLLHENRQFLPMDHGVLSILTLPWRLAIPGAGDDQFIGPLLLAFLPVFFLLRLKNPALKYLARTVFLSFLMGLTLSHMLRFSMPAFVLAFLVLSAALGRLKDRKWKWLWTGVVAVGALCCIPEYLFISAIHYDGWGIWSGRENRQNYVERMMRDSSGTVTRWVDENLPPDARLLVVGDAQVLYYKRSAYANSVFDEQFFAAAAKGEKGPEGILRRLKELGITHVVVNQILGPFNSDEYHQYELDREQWRKINEFSHRGLELLMGEKQVGLYRVRENLAEKSGLISNPFCLFPIQAFYFLEDFSNKNYSKAKVELDQLLSFFPGDPYWKNKKFELMKKVK